MLDGYSERDTFWGGLFSNLDKLLINKAKKNPNNNV